MDNHKIPSAFLPPAVDLDFTTMVQIEEEKLAELWQSKLPLMVYHQSVLQGYYSDKHNSSFWWTKNTMYPLLSECVKGCYKTSVKPPFAKLLVEGFIDMSLKRTLVCYCRLVHSQCSSTVAFSCYTHLIDLLEPWQYCYIKNKKESIARFFEQTFATLHEQVIPELRSRGLSFSLYREGDELAPQGGVLMGVFSYE